MNGKLKLIILSALSLSMSTAMAATNSVKTPPHTWHTISTSQGTWSGRLQMINEEGSFIGRDGASLTTFTINPNQPQDFGFSFTPDADFNIAYTLTLTEQDAKAFSSKACVYVISASGPAQPDIRASSYNSATCGWKVIPGKGEDFSVA